MLMPTSRIHAVLQVPKVRIPQTKYPVSESLHVLNVAQQVMRMGTVAKHLTVLTVTEITVLSPGSAQCGKGRKTPRQSK